MLSSNLCFKMFRLVGLFSLRVTSQNAFQATLNCRLNSSIRRFTNAVTNRHQASRDQKDLSVAVKQLLDRHTNGKITDQESRVALLQQIAHVASEDSDDRKHLLEQKFRFPFESLLDDVGANIKESRRQELSVILWSLGRLRARQPWLVQECEKRLLELNVKHFSDTQLCMMSWGLAQTAVQKPEKLLERIKVEILRRGVRTLQDSKLCMLLRAFTDPHMKDKDLFILFEEDILLRGFTGCSEVLLVQCALSFARTQYGSMSLFNGIANELIRRDLSQLTDRALADALWSYSKANVKHCGLVEIVQQELTARSLNKFETANLAKIAWALAKQKPQPQNAEVFKNIEAQLLQCDPSRISEGNIVQTLWAFAQTGGSNGEIFIFFEEELLKRDFSRSPRNHLYLMAWSFAKCHPQALALLEKIFKTTDSWGSSKFGRRERKDLKLIKDKLLRKTI